MTMRRHPNLRAVPPGVIDQVSPPDPAFTGAWAALGDMQEDIAQAQNPALNNRWGWLTQQGNLLLNGQQASLTQAQFVAAVDALQSQTNAAPSETSLNMDYPTSTNPLSDLLTGTSPSYGTLTPNAPAPTLLQQIMPYVPWVVGGIVAILVLPPLVRAITGEK